MDRPLDLHPRRGAEKLAFLVPNPEQPVLWVPLTQEIIDQLPIRRLNRYIREGIREAQCAVETHWCKWVPSALTEADYLTDLSRRLLKIQGLTPEGK